MKITPLHIQDVILFEPKIFSDDRGYFFESFNSKLFLEVVGRKIKFSQDNQSFSKQAVLRGLHYQIIRPQGKLVSVITGEIFDVAVDLRQNSPTAGQYVSQILSAENKKQLWIPEGFSHGFLVLSEFATVQYKVTDYWYPEYERCIRFDDKKLNITWPDVIDNKNNIIQPQLSAKDLAGSGFLAI